MKMAKKFLAVALAGVLALSVLTGCGKDKVDTKSLAKAVSTVAGYTVTESTDLNKLAKGAVKTAVDKVISDDSTKATDYSNVLTKDVTDKKVVAAAGGVASTGAYKDNQVKVILVELKDTELSTQVYQLTTALNAATDGATVETYTPSGSTFAKHTDAKMGTTTFKSGDKTYLLAVVTMAKDAA